jgi:hypothetical protein
LDLLTVECEAHSFDQRGNTLLTQVSVAAAAIHTDISLRMRVF